MINEKKIWLISLVMGLGHLRAAYPLRDIAYQGIFIEGNEGTSSKIEYRTWKRVQRLYYFMSNAYRIPLIGKYIHNLLNTLEHIPSYYPKRDLSKPTGAVLYMNYLINKKNLSYSIEKMVVNNPLPVVSSYYTSSIAIDTKCPEIKNNFQIICDTDCNRIWVSKKPESSKIQYFAPCSEIKNRLIEYGVYEKNIHLTGFPLPKENIGADLSILHDDLSKRLIRLDPNHDFRKIHSDDVYRKINRDITKSDDSKIPALMFAVGGSGVQVEMIYQILKSLKEDMIKSRINFSISCGISKNVYEKVIKDIKKLELADYIGNGIELIYSSNIIEYLEKFNYAIRNVDILWTKPSELTFYCALGLPIIISKPVGSHEEYNKKWLYKLHAGISAPNNLKYTNEWIFDLIDDGTFADIAWNGYLKAEKMGTYNIEKIITNCVN